MPHRCTNCENIIQDESNALLEGCPNCDNKSWEYLENAGTSSEDESQRKARTEFIDSEDIPGSSTADVLQNPNVAVSDDNSFEPIEESEQVRERLNQQYEGIKVVRKGHYEINLASLYRGHSYIIEVGDDGAYKVKNVERG